MADQEIRRKGSTDPNEVFVAPEGTPIPEGYERINVFGQQMLAPKPGVTPSAEAQTQVGGLMRNAFGIDPKTVGATVAPTAGGMLGQYLGGMIPGGGRAGSILGESAGSAAGTAFNQAVGLEPPSLTQIGVSAGLGPLARGTMGTLRAIPAIGAKMLPGSSAARQMAAVDTLNGIPGIVRPQSPSSLAYAEVGRLNPEIGLSNTARALDGIAAENAMLVPGLERKQVDLIADGLKNKMGAIGRDAMPFQEYWANMKSLRETIDNMGRQGGIGQGQLIKLRKAMMDDLDAAAASPGLSQEAAQKLKGANALFKKELASDSLEEVIRNNGIGNKGELLYVQPNAVLSYMRKDPDGVIAFLDPAEKKQIEQTLAKLAKVPALPAAASPGVNFGGFQQIKRAGLGAAVGGMIGGPMGAAVGVPAAAYGSEIISRALMTERGRKALTAVMDRGGYLDWPKVATVAIALRGPINVGSGE